MNVLKIALLVTVAALLLVVVIDRSRQSEQMKALHDEMRSVRQSLDRGVQVQSVAGPAKTAWKPPAVTAPRDGNPVLGVNFLMPYERGWHHRAWRGGTLKVFGSTPKGLNPLLDNSSDTSAVHGLCNDSLCDRPPWAPEQWMEGLAESVEISDDFRTYTFRIRAGVRWQRPACASDPAFAWLAKDVPLTSEDFKFTLDLIRDPQVECPQLRVYYEDLDRVECPDPRTLVLRWKRKIYTSLSFSLGLSPLPRHIYRHSRDGAEIPAAQVAAAFNKHWFDELRQVVGVGAYRLDEFQPDKRAVFRRNPDYWGSGLHFDAIEWNLEVVQPDAQLVHFKNGEVHVHGLTPLRYKSEILDRNDPGFAAPDPADPKAGRRGELAWQRIKAMSFNYLGWNMRRPPFDDRRVRQAMSLAFPRERIIKDVFMGLGQPVESDVHPDSQYCNRELKPWAFDPARAARLLAEAGWTDSDQDGVLDREIKGERRQLSFEVKYYANSPEWDNTLAIYRNELRRIGVDMQPKTYQWKELLRVYEDKDFAAIVGGWAMDWDIDYYQLWHSSQVDIQSSSNHCGFADPRVDTLAEKLRLTFDTKERIAIVKEIQAIIHEAQPYTFFRSGEGIFCWQNAGRGRALDGVDEGLDLFHPLVNRSRLLWRFRE